MSAFIEYRDLAVLLRRWADELEAQDKPAPGVLIPLYIRPGAAWDRVAAVARAHPSVPIVAILNPASGPGTSQSATYVDGIKNLLDAQVQPIGYVSTDYGRRSIENTKSDISRWATWYPDIHGIFLDEMVTKPDLLGYYLSAQSFVLEHFDSVVGNPGTTPHPDMFQAADALVVAEGTSPPAAQDLAELEEAGGAGKLAVLVHGASAGVVTDWLPEAKAFLRYVYITDDVLPNPWNTLSAYFEETVRRLSV